MAFDYAAMGMQAGGVIILIIVLVLVIAFISFLMIQKKKRDIFKKTKIMVWKRHKTHDGREMPIIEDMFEKGAVVFDKKMNKWSFHLKNANIDMGEEEMENFDENREMDIPSVPYTKGGEVVFVEKLANKKYAFGEPFIIDGKVKIKVTEADLAEAKRSYSMFVKTFGKKQNPLLAFVIYVTFAVLILILIFVLLNKFDLIVTASENLKVASEVAARGSAVPSVVPT